MTASEGRIHSLQSLGTVDGPGLRSVVFMQGCPLRCRCCHNPDTWDPAGGETVTADSLAARLLSYRPYWRRGGVTVTGGEPLMQAEFVTELFTILKGEGVHTALDTSGCRLDEAAHRLLDVTDLVLLDIKQTTPEAYRAFGAGDMRKPLEFLEELSRRGKDVWVRHVVIPGLTDGQENIRKLAELIRPYSCVKKVELLPFQKLCLEKYEAMGIPFPLADTPAADGDAVARLHDDLDRYIRGNEDNDEKSSGNSGQ